MVYNSSPFYGLVKQALFEKEMSQNYLAERLNVSPQYVSQLMNGRTAPSSQRKYIPKIIEILDIDSSELPDEIKSLLY